MAMYDMKGVACGDELTELSPHSAVPLRSMEQLRWGRETQHLIIRQVLNKPQS